MSISTQLGSVLVKENSSTQTIDFSISTAEVKQVLQDVKRCENFERVTFRISFGTNIDTFIISAQFSEKVFKATFKKVVYLSFSNLKFSNKSWKGLIKFLPMFEKLKEFDFGTKAKLNHLAIATQMKENVNLMHFTMNFSDPNLNMSHYDFSTMRYLCFKIACKRVARKMRFYTRTKTDGEPLWQDFIRALVRTPLYEDGSQIECTNGWWINPEYFIKVYWDSFRSSEATLKSRYTFTRSPPKPSTSG